jgi:hypothetical protein
VPRSVSSWLTRWVDRIVTGAFRLVTRAIAGYRRRDRVLAAQAATIPLARVAAWLGASFIGFWLPPWPFETGIPAATTTFAPGVGWQENMGV